MLHTIPTSFAESPFEMKIQCTKLLKDFSKMCSVPKEHVGIDRSEWPSHATSLHRFGPIA